MPGQQPQIIYVERAPEKKKTGCFTWLMIIILGLAVISVILRDASRPSSEREPDSKGETSKSEASTPKPSTGVTITKANWQKGGFGTVLLADLTVKNSNPTAIRDIRFAVNVSGESGTTLDTLRYTATVVIQPGEERTLKGLNFGRIPQQAARTSFRVTSVKEDFDGLGL